MSFKLLGLNFGVISCLSSYSLNYIPFPDFFLRVCRHKHFCQVLVEIEENVDIFHFFLAENFALEDAVLI
jgi:hypothetical protein